MRKCDIKKCALKLISVDMTGKIEFYLNGIEVDKPLLKNGKNGNFYKKERDTG